LKQTQKNKKYLPAQKPAGHTNKCPGTITPALAGFAAERFLFLKATVMAHAMIVDQFNKERSMKRFLTTSGGYITATDEATAAALAAEYGMGKIAGVEAAPAKTKPVVRAGNFAVWDNISQAASTVGTLAACVAHQYDYPQDGDVVFFGSGKPEKLNTAELRQVKSWLRDAE